MGKKDKERRLKKEKKYEQEENYNELSENEEDENPDQNNYIKDDFLVDDDEEEIDNVPRFQISNNDSLKELDEEDEDESLNSSDREVIGQHPTKKKKLRKKNHIKEKEEDDFKIDDDNYNEDINNIEKNKISSDNNANINNDINEDDNLYSDDINKESNSITHDLKLSNNDNIAHQIFKLPPEEQQQHQQIEQKSIKQIFTEEELEEQLATPFDNEIKINDFPERMQLLYSKEDLQNLMDNLEAEVNWIFDKMKFNNNDENEENLRKKIFLVLECNKKDFLDIPYIVMFKKYIYDPELSVNNIWKIFELDRKYYEIVQYKKIVNNQYNNVKNLMHENQYTFMREKYINDAKSINDLKNMEEYINYIKECSINNNDNNDNNNNEKHIFPIKKSFINECITNKIDQFIKQSMLNSMEIAINLEFILKNIDIDSSQLCPAPVPSETPAQLANKFINNVYKEEMEIMNKACKFIAINLTSHPFIKSYIYSVFYEKCYISTKPTEKGSNELDIFHPLFRTKRIYNKPVSSFDNDLFMYIIESEKRNLITVDIKIKENINNNDDKKNNNNNDDDFKELKKILLKAAMPNNDSIDNRWELFRSEGIRIAINDLKQSYQKEIRNILLEKAENFIIEKASINFYNLLMSGPYRIKLFKDTEKNEDKFTDSKIPRVMSFVFDQNKNLTYSIIVNKNGEIVDHFVFTTLHIKNRFKENEEKEKLKDFIKQHSPDLLVVAANDLRAKNIKENIDNCDENLMRSTKRVIYGNLELPTLYANSELSEKNFPNYSIYLKQCISLARYQQNPIEEILQLWSENINKNFCLKINLHPLQSIINQKKLLIALQFKAIEAVNNIGVDINKAFEFSHLRNSLQFICGLGPRKAKYLIERLIPTQGAIQKKLLYTEKICGKKTILSALPFLMIKTNIYKNSVDLDDYDLLDMTRIPLDWCPIARKLISEALNIKNNLSSTDIEEILKDPKKLESLDLNDYIKRLVDNNNSLSNNNNNTIEHSKKAYTEKIALIKSELNNPFSDPRNEFTGLSEMQIFNLLIGDESFTNGQMTVATVIKVEKQHVRCRLINELEAALWVADISNENITEEDMKNKFKENLIFEARVKQINYNHFKVDLTTKQTELESNKNYLKNEDLDKDFFKILPEDYINKKYIKEKKTHKRYTYRNLHLEKFKNFNFKQCEEYLRNKDIGECIFRPSSRGPDHLTLSWKFYKYIISHVDIIEKDKLPGMNIGNKLIINDEIYSTLNEIIERFVIPCSILTRQASEHRKFLNMDNIFDFEKKLKDDKEKNKEIINYNFTIVKNFPGYLLLGYVPKTNVIIEYIKIKPKGYYFHQTFFKDLDEVINFFKTNFGSDSYIDFVRKYHEPVIEYNKNETKNEENKNFEEEQGNYKGNYYKNRHNNKDKYLNNKRDRSPRRDRDRDRDRERDRDRDRDYRRDHYHKKKYDDNNNYNYNNNNNNNYNEKNNSNNDNNNNNDGNDWNNNNNNNTGWGTTNINEIDNNNATSWNNDNNNNNNGSW